MTSNLKHHKSGWTDTDERYLKQSFLKQSIEQIADHLQRTPIAIQRRASKLGLYPYTIRFKNNILNRIKEQLSYHDLSRRQLSKQLGIGFSSLFKPLRYLLDIGDVASYKRKDVDGLGRAKIIYALVKEKTI